MIWGIPGWHSSLAPAFGPGHNPGDPGSNPTSGSRCMEPASTSAYVSASLSLSLCVTIIKKKKKSWGGEKGEKLTLFFKCLIKITKGRKKSKKKQKQMQWEEQTWYKHGNINLARWIMNLNIDGPSIPLKRQRLGIPGLRSDLAPAFGPGHNPGDPGLNPRSGSRCKEPASPSACVSASLSLSLSLCDYHKQTKKKRFNMSRWDPGGDQSHQVQVRSR